jgi:predicted GIY-YIG superfamily endonuclease
MDNDWFFYIIKNKNYTYAGVSPTPTRRLRQHNGEIAGGAKYTTSKGPGWEHICLVSGFRDKIEALQFEWAVKHAPPRNAGGIENRLKKLRTTCCKERWTANAPLAQEVPLHIHWIRDPTMFVSFNDDSYPEYVSQFCDPGNDETDC